MAIRTVLPAPVYRRPKPTNWLEASLGGSTILLRLLLLIVLAQTIFIFVQPHLLVQQLHQRERVVILDTSGPTYTITPLLSFEEAQDLHTTVARDALAAMFNRSPADFDRPDLVKMVFLKNAREKLQRLKEGEDSEFRAKNFFQKVNADIQKVTATENTVIVNIRGQLIRTGVFQNRTFVDTRKFDLNLTLLRNPNMLVNKRYPLSVADYDLSYL